MGSLFAGILKALGGLLGSGAAGGGAASTLDMLKSVPTKQNYANMGVDSSAWTPAATGMPTAQVSSPSTSSLIGASLASGGRGGKGRQASEQMAQAFSQPPDMSQAVNPMSFLQQVQNMQHPQIQQTATYAQPSSLIQYLLQLNNRRQ